MYSIGIDNGMGKKFDEGGVGVGGVGGRCIMCCGGLIIFMVWVGVFIVGGYGL